MRLESYDARFDRLTLGNAPPERLWTGGRWVEGPVYFRDGRYLLWSDIPNDRILRWTEDGATGVFRQPSGFANGNTRDRQGRLVTCEHLARRVTRTELDGTVTVLADQTRHGCLNSPNDVVVHSDGGVWFTDPTYGILSDYEGRRAESEQPGCFVYRWDSATGRLDVVVEDLVQPNGLAFASDETVLYVSDTGGTHDPDGPHHIVAYDVVDGRTLRGARVLAQIAPGVPDGLSVDELDHVWTSAGDGIQCWTPDGVLIGKVVLPEVASNCTFGGAFGHRLFITASSSVYAVFLGVRGAQGL